MISHFDNTFRVDMDILLILRFGISVPLVFLGAFFGYKKAQFGEFMTCFYFLQKSHLVSFFQAPISLPVRTNQIPRQVPAQPWYITGDRLSESVSGPSCALVTSHEASWGTHRNRTRERLAH